MEKAVPWAKLVAYIHPFYAREASGTDVAELEQILRLYFLKQWYGLDNDGLEDALYESQSMRGFAKIDLETHFLVDPAAILKFRQILERNALTPKLQEEVEVYFSTHNLIMREGSIVDAGVVAEPPWLESLIWPAIISFLILGIFAVGFRPSGQREALTILSSIPLGLLFGIAGIKFGKSRSSLGFISDRRWIYPAMAGVGACSLALLIYWCGMRQFGGGDCSVSIDVGWRLLCGQKPYIDFPCTMPIGFYLGSELAFRLFGVFWRSQVLIQVLYETVTFVWLWKLFEIILWNRTLALLTAVFCEASTLLLVSYWWYNPLTSITGVLCIASCMAVLCSPKSAGCWISFTLSLCLAALMKPNVSGFIIVGSVASLCIRRGLWKRAAAASVCGFVLWLLIIKIHGSTIQQVIGGYLSVANRGLSPSEFCFMQDLTPLERMLSLAAFVIACIPWVAAAAAKPARLASARGVATLFGFAAGVYGFLTNNDLKLCDIPLELVSGILLIGYSPGEPSKLTLPLKWRPYIYTLLTVLTFASVAQAVTRHRVQVMGYGLFFEYPLRDKPLSIDFFRGLRAGNNLEAVIERASDLCRRSGEGPVFFGPRLQWAYAAFKIPAPVNEPAFWQPGAYFAREDEPRYTRRWFQTGYNAAMFLDFLYYSPEFVKTLNDLYQIDSTFPSVYLARDPYQNDNHWPLLIIKKRPGRER